MPCYTLGRLAKVAKADLKGDPELEIRGLSPIQSARAGDLSFITDRVHIKMASESEASAVIVPRDYVNDNTTALLFSDDPYLAYARISPFFKNQPSPSPGVDSSATIADSADIGDDCHIGPGVVVGDNAVVAKGCVVGANSIIGAHCILGEDCVLAAGITLYPRCVLGNGVRLHSGAVVGSDGFGYANDNALWVKIEHLGRVIIEDRAEIGALTSIDRGTLNDTVIGQGVIIDNQVQVGHNVKIGENTAIAGGVLVAGSVVIGKRCRIGGGAAIAGHIEIGDDITIGGRTNVAKSILKKGVYMSPLLAMERSEWRKNIVWIRHLDTMGRTIRKLVRNKSN